MSQIEIKLVSSLEECIGKTVVEYRELEMHDLYWVRFSGNLAFAWRDDYDSGYRVLEGINDLYDSELVELGLKDRDEYEREQAESKRRSEANEKARRRHNFEELKKEFEP